MANTDRAPEVMTPDQVAEYLQVDRETVYRYIRSGELTASKLGRHYRIPKPNVEALLWATTTRPDVRLRRFTDEQIAEYDEADRLTGRAKEIATQFDTYVKARAAQSE
ncbi:MAG: helix-turn-helix domain-containing protein [Chloroflexi bacterium]|nr:helix-turn-helix domain-containing protein [Chloroflexota bacterium]